MPDNTIKILLFLAQGFEDLEAISIIDVFGWTQYREDIKKASVITTGFHPIIKSRFGLEIKPDALFSEVNPKDYQAFVLPGGFYSYGFDEAFDKSIHRLASDIYNNGGYIATMCVGILPIADAGLLKGKKATTYPHSRNHDNIGRLKKNGAEVVKSPVVFDDRIISCSGPGSALDVAFLLMEHLMGSKTSQEVRKFMIYKNEWGGPELCRTIIWHSAQYIWNFSNLGRQAMLNQILLYSGSAFVSFWGVAHLFPTRSVVSGFGEISIDNKRIITMEWIIEGISLIFIGSINAIVTAIDHTSSISLVIYLSSVAVLIVLALVSFLTGFKISFLPFKLCPVIFIASAVLISLGALL